MKHFDSKTFTNIYNDISDIVCSRERMRGERPREFARAQTFKQHVESKFELNFVIFDGTFDSTPRQFQF